MANKTKKPELSQLEKAIESRERGIHRMHQNVREIEQRAAREVAEIRKRIESKQVLLDALKRGQLKP
jgi:molecular chaperone GrpE (heat shock protein)